MCNDNWSPVSPSVITYVNDCYYNNSANFILEQPGDYLQGGEVFYSAAQSAAPASAHQNSYSDQHSVPDTRQYVDRSVNNYSRNR